jgi:hypothetical protein
MGEKLSVIEPPNLPAEPLKPNRPLILALGLFVAGVGSIGSGVLADLLGGRVYRPRQLAAMLGHAPLAVVPRIRTARNRRRAIAKGVAVVLVFALILAGAALYLQHFVAPLEVLWAALLNRFGLS